MRLTVSDEQRALRDAVRRFLADRAPLARVRVLMDTPDGIDRAVWDQAGTQLGLQGIAIPEAYGGGGFTFAEQAIVLEELGARCTAGRTWPAPCSRPRRCWPAPTRPPGASCCLASRPARPWPRWPSPRTTGPGRPRRSGSPRPATAAGWVLDGHKSFVLDGHTADLILVVAGPARAVAVRRAARRARPDRRRGLPTLDQTRKLARLEFGSVPARRIDGDGAAVLARTLDVAAIALAAEQLGGAQRALEMAVSYAKDRQQFGRPIGSFQAIKHRCADLLLEVESLRSAVGYAAAAVAEDSAEIPVVASLVKAYASDVYFHVAAENIQIHGGIGFTWEHDAHLYFKRAKASELFLGDASYHREHLAERIGV